MAKEMGLDRAPIEFRKLVFLVPPRASYLIKYTLCWTSLLSVPWPLWSASSSWPKSSKRRSNSNPSSRKEHKLQAPFSSWTTLSTESPPSCQPCRIAWNTWSSSGCRASPLSGWGRPAHPERGRLSPVRGAQPGEDSLAGRSPFVPFLLKTNPDVFKSIYSTLSVYFVVISFVGRTQPSLC